MADRHLAAYHRRLNIKPVYGRFDLLAHFKTCYSTQIDDVPTYTDRWVYWINDDLAAEDLEFFQRNVRAFLLDEERWDAWRVTLTLKSVTIVF